MILHGTALQIGDSGVLLRGASGSGKSDLAFRLIEEQDAGLISDDQVRIDDDLFLHGIETIRGLLEVRGLGLLRYPAADPVKLQIIIDLVAREDVPRLPAWETADIAGAQVPRLKLHAFDPSTPLKVRRAAEVARNPEAIIR